MDSEMISRKPSAVTNSVGNLVYHLVGNARQWIIAGFGFESDIRNRNNEFENPGPFTREELKKLLADLKIDLLKYLPAINQQMINKHYSVQAFDVSGMSMLVHVIEHFSYHTGQITLLCKLYTSKETGYYSSYTLD